MQDSTNVKRDAAEDIYYGQVVINWARWFIVAAGIVLVLWTAEEESRAVLGIIPIVAIMGINFYLHGRLLAERPAKPTLVAITSVLDLAVITTLVLVWSQHTGLASPFFILYYPVVLAFAFVMPPKISIPFTVATLIAYGAACFLADPALISSVAEVKALTLRAITLGAMGGLAAYYWRIEIGHPRSNVRASSDARDRTAVAQ